MGAYVNPTNESKEEWLSHNGEAVRQSHLMDFDFSGKELPVVLVDCGTHSAAGIAYNWEELAVFLDITDPRSKKYFIVSKEKLLAVSNLKAYLK